MLGLAYPTDSAMPLARNKLCNLRLSPLLALHAGRLSVDEALKQADNAERKGEAMFQIGVAYHQRDREEARRWWGRVVEATGPSTIEHAAARHQLVHFGS